MVTAALTLHPAGLKSDRARLYSLKDGPSINVFPDRRGKYIGGQIDYKGRVGDSGGIDLPLSTAPWEQ